MMACTLCKLVSGDNKIPLNTYADFKTRGKEGEKEEEEEGKVVGGYLITTISRKLAQIGRA